MINFLTGVPGSGKTYYAVYSLYSNFGKNKKLQDPKFKITDAKKAFTNINQLDLKKYKNVYELDWDKFYNLLNLAYSMQKKNKYTDEQIKEALKDEDFFDCYFVIDECHNHFDTQDKILVWWLSYHRHFHQEILLITQNLSLVDSKYKAFSEFFYQAVPSSLRLFKNTMKFKQFIGSRLYKKQQSSVKKVPFVKDIFKTYHSGATSKGERVILKLFGLVLIGFLLLGGGFYFVKNFLFGDGSNSDTNSSISSSIKNSLESKYLPRSSRKKDDDEDDPNRKIRVIFNCEKEKNICSTNDKFFSYAEFKYFRDNKDFEVLDLVIIPSTRFVKVYTLASYQFYKYHIRSVNNEKNSTNRRNSSEFGLF